MTTSVIVWEYGVVVATIPSIFACRYLRGTQNWFTSACQRRHPVWVGRTYGWHSIVGGWHHLNSHLFPSLSGASDGSFSYRLGHGFFCLSCHFYVWKFGSLICAHSFFVEWNYCTVVLCQSFNCLHTSLTIPLVVLRSCRPATLNNLFSWYLLRIFYVPVEDDAKVSSHWRCRRDHLAWLIDLLLGNACVCVVRGTLLPG